MNTAPPDSARLPKLPGRAIVIAIGVFKILKGCLMVLLSVTALAFTQDNFNYLVFRWANDLDVGPYRRHVGNWVTLHILGLSDQTLRVAAVGAALYATLFATEGLGLLMDKLWAEWLAVISTGCLIPLEIVEIVRKHGVLMTLMFLGNVAIVIYMAYRVRQRMKYEAKYRNLLSPTEIPPATAHPDAGSCEPGR